MITEKPIIGDVGSDCVFRGTFQECVDYLARCYCAHVPKGSRHSSEARASIAGFCRVSDGTVVGWIMGHKHFPEGEVRLRLMCYLDMIGFRVLELDNLVTRKGFAELIGYGVLSPKKAAELVGYSNEHGVFRILKPGEGIPAEKSRKILETWRARRDELEARKEEYEKKYPVGFPLIIEKRAVEEEEKAVLNDKVSSVCSPIQQGTDAGFYQATMSIIFALAGLLQQSQVANLSPREAKSLFLGDRETIDKLSLGLCALASKLSATGKEDQDGGECTKESSSSD